MAIFIEFDYFFVNRVLGASHKGGGAAVRGSVIPYPLFFLKACKVMFMMLNGHHGVLLSKLTIYERGCEFSNIPYLLFFRFKFYLILFLLIIACFGSIHATKWPFL